MPLVFSQPGKMGCAGFSLLSPLLKTCLQQRQEDGGAETSHHPLANRLSEVTSPNNPGTIQLPSCHISGHVWDHTQGLSPASIESGHPKPWPGGGFCHSGGNPTPSQGAGKRTATCICLVAQSFPLLDCAEEHLPCLQESWQLACPLPYSLPKDIQVVRKMLGSTEKASGGLRNRGVIHIYESNEKA